MKVDMTPTHKADSYRQCECCGVDCAYRDVSTPDEPCWGPVRIEYEFEDGGDVHTCQGHAAIWRENDGETFYWPEEPTP